MKKGKKSTHIAIVLDRSSSMDIIRTEAVALFNAQVATIKKSKGNVKTSLFTFSTVADKPTIFNMPVSKLKNLTEKSYKPSGYTAMFDGIGECVDKLSALPEAEEKDSAFLVIIITDGEENSSKKYSASLISERIKLLQSTGRWTFSFLGANIDVEKMGNTLHIPAGNTMSWESSSIGTQTASGQTVASTRSYLSNRAKGGAAKVDNFYEQGKSKKAK